MIQVESLGHRHDREAVELKLPESDISRGPIRLTKLAFETYVRPKRPPLLTKQTTVSSAPENSVTAPPN